MLKKRVSQYLGIAGISFLVSSCITPPVVERTETRTVPARYYDAQDTTNTVRLKWQEFFTDPDLNGLINTALNNNQELNITLQEIQIANSEIRTRKGKYLPFVGIRGGAGVEKVGRYTNIGASEATTDIAPETETPEPLPDYTVSAFASWEVDIWRKMRNAKKAAVSRYLASMEGKNFLVTNLVAEIATSYYELLALDSQLDIVKHNIEIQQNALDIVRMEKAAARVTELAVRRFEAQVLSTRSLQYTIQQRIIETENRTNFLVGRYPQPIQRNFQTFTTLVPSTIGAGIPSQLLANRPDIKQAELELLAAKLDVKSARANFYP